MSLLPSTLRSTAARRALEGDLARVYRVYRSLATGPALGVRAGRVHRDGG